MRQLMKHQEQALAYALRTQHPAIFLEMRLGKSLTVIRYAGELGAHAILVVAPKTVLVSWAKELSLEGQWFHRLQEKAEADVARLLHRFYGRRPIWFLVNYERLRVTPALTKLPWDLVVLDESTAIKNPQAQITRICAGGSVNRKPFPGFYAADHRCILSGAPMPESEMDLFEQFRFLDGEFAGCTNWFQFRQKYFHQSKFQENLWHPHQGTAKLIKGIMHSRAFVRTRKQVGIGPRKIFEVRHVELPAALATAYRQAEREYSVGGVWETKWQIVLQQWLARMAGGFNPDGEYVSTHKVNELVNLLQGELVGEAVVVWFRFLAEMDAVAARFRQLGWKFAQVRGETEDRDTPLRRFEEQKIQYLLMQVRVGKYGIDCSAADTAVYFSNEFSCETRLQSEDRILHPQKKAPLLYVDLVTRGTIEEDVLNVLRRKKTNSRLYMRALKEEFERRLLLEGRRK